MNTNDIFGAYDSVLKITAGGMRESDGDLVQDWHDSEYQQGLYWTSTTTQFGMVYRINFREDTAGFFESSSLGRGMSVRCIMD